MSSGVQAPPLPSAVRLWPAVQLFSAAQCGDALRKQSLRCQHAAPMEQQQQQSETAGMSGLTRGRPR